MYVCGAMLRETFLFRVFKKDKLLFIVFTIFILCQIFFTWKQVENTPFFLFGMYSAVHEPHKSYTVYDIEIDQKRVKSHDFHDHQREVVYNTIATYDGLRQMGFRDSLDKVISHRLSGPTADLLRQRLLNSAKMDTPYQRWLFSYIADMRMVKTPTIEVRKTQVAYQTDGSVKAIDNAATVFKLRDE
jgi:hypothetical protein